MTLEAKKTSQKTVKAFETDIALINSHAKVLGVSAAEIIHSMCEELRRKTYLEEIGETFDLVRADAKLLAESQKETELWDTAIYDGLEDAT